MALQFRFPENLKFAEVMNPATDAAGRTGTVVTLKQAHKAWFVFHINQGSASTILLSLLQGTAGAGTTTLTGSKAGPSVPIWVNTNTATNDTLVIQTAFASTYTTDAGTNNKMVVFEVDPLYLDGANGFKDVTVSTGASSASNITQCVVYTWPRYEGGTPPTILVD